MERPDLLLAAQQDRSVSGIGNCPRRAGVLCQPVGAPAKGSPLGRAWLLVKMPPCSLHMGDGTVHNRARPASVVGWHSLGGADHLLIHVGWDPSF